MKTGNKQKISMVVVVWVSFFAYYFSHYAKEPSIWIYWFFLIALVVTCWIKSYKERDGNDKNKFLQSENFKDNTFGFILIFGAPVLSFYLLTIYAKWHWFFSSLVSFFVFLIFGIAYLFFLRIKSYS